MSFEDAARHTADAISRTPKMPVKHKLILLDELRKQLTDANAGAYVDGLRRRIAEAAADHKEA